ncbi:MAG: hypothetical protein AAFR65_03860 [Pseudomonadota bacterium]
MIKSIATAVAAALMITVPAHAAVFTFDVTVVNVTNLSSSESQAEMADYNAAFLDASAQSDTFVYQGELDFRTSDGTDATTIGDWLATGGGTVTGLDGTVADLQLSKPNINNGTATTTFFFFELQGTAAAGDVAVTHDDGFAIFEDDAFLGGVLGPVSETFTLVQNYNGGEFDLLYVATNGDPSILEVDLSPVPVPAALPLFVGGMSLFGIASRRRRKAA